MTTPAVGEVEQWESPSRPAASARRLANLGSRLTPTQIAPTPDRKGSMRIQVPPTGCQKALWKLKGSPLRRPSWKRTASTSVVRPPRASTATASADPAGSSSPFKKA